MIGHLARGVQSNQIMGDIKHYAVNDQETGRNSLNAIIDERTARETDLLAQSEGDLGLRLTAAFESVFSRGLGPVLALGADSPDLPLEIIARALDALRAGQCDVALGPAADGGYTLIGLRRAEPAIFEA